jgi:hypothetical protein
MSSFFEIKNPNHVDISLQVYALTGKALFLAQAQIGTISLLMVYCPRFPLD